MSKPKLTEADFERAARKLRCSVPAIKAVAEVESRGAGFYADGFPVILFERHKFRSFTQGRYNKSHPHLSGPAGNYGKAGQNQRNKFNQAFALNPDAAMKACSWGKFQIMGFNHAICGYATVGQFVDAMKESEGKQLDAFVAFVVGNRLDGHLRNLNWAGFARGYNGPGYAKNQYDTKMARAYAKYLKLSAASPTLLKDDAPLTEPTGSTILDEPSSQPPNEQNVGEVSIPAPEPYNGIGFWATIKRDLALATGGNFSLSGLAEYAQQATGWPEWVIGLLGKLAIGALIATFGYFVFRVLHYFVDTWKKNQKVRTELDAANATGKSFEVKWI